MNSRVVMGCAASLTAIAMAACGESPTPPEEPPPLPEPTQDQVGLPENYATEFRQFYVFDRPDNKQVRVVYANDLAAANRPYQLGAILVMETYRALQDAQGVPVLDPGGRYQRDQRTGIFVMRKEKWFGRRYGEHQTGEWEYASFRADGSPNVVGDAAAAACAICHLDAGLSRDWVYRANIFFDGGSGALPQPPADQPADQPFVDSYTYVPATTTVPVGTRVTWTNRDQVKHTVTTADGAFSALVSQGATASRTFSAAGTFNYFCAIHPAMKGTVVVQP